LTDRVSNLEKKMKEIEQRLSKLEKSKSPTGMQKTSSNLVNKIREKINEIGIQHLIILALKIKSKQTKSEIEDILRGWNKPIGSWFKGGNFNRRLLGKGIIMKDGENDSQESQFSLTMRGLKEAEKIVSRYNL
jgi:hypothetical protein